MSDPIIKINPSKPSELQFEVSVQGSEDVKPIVRIAMNGCDEYLCVFECEHVQGSTWMVKLPPLKHFTRTTVPFYVEVMIDGYYFVPAEGVAQLMEDPQVMFQKQSTKPTVSTSFTVKQDTDKPKAEEDEQVGRMPVAQYGGELSPTNQFMEPEFEPTQSTVKIGNAPAYDRQIDKTRIEDISSSVLPGETTDPEPQHGNNPTDEGDEEDFDPRRVAESIVQNTIGKGQSKPQTQGTLFKRDAAGKAVISGIESPATKAAKQEKAQRVRDILQAK